MPEIQVQQRLAQPVLFLRRTVRPHEMQAALAACLPAVFAHCQSHWLALMGAPFTRYVEHGADHFLIEAGMPVRVAEPMGEVLAGTLPGGEVAVAVHAGPYDTLGQTHAALRDWAVAHGRSHGAAWESYLTDPTASPDPADWRTEVCLPLAS
ncbi:MAG: GyrI-like domain-containing protein [Alphaproteobacteria bacterium]|nr:GyrI-like domain-containing protein [Alphaproteobacteria bacterium]